MGKRTPNPNAGVIHEQTHVSCGMWPVLSYTVLMVEKCWFILQRSHGDRRLAGNAASTKGATHLRLAVAIFTITCPWKNGRLDAPWPSMG